MRKEEIWIVQNYIEKIINTYDEQFEKFKQKKVLQIILQGEETLEEYLIKNNYRPIRRND